MFFSYLIQKSKTSECLVLEYICIECVHYDLIFHIHVAISAEWPWFESASRNLGLFLGKTVYFSLPSASEGT